jgi:hypothetical protein
VIHPHREPHATEGVGRARAPLGGGDPRVEQPVRHVLERAHPIEQEELLEHEPDRAGPERRELAVGGARDVEAGDVHLAAGRTVERAHHVQQRRFARAARPTARSPGSTGARRQSAATPPSCSFQRPLSITGERPIAVDVTSSATRDLTTPSPPQTLDESVSRDLGPCRGVGVAHYYEVVRWPSTTRARTRPRRASATGTASTPRRAGLRSHPPAPRRARSTSRHRTVTVTVGRPDRSRRPRPPTDLGDAARTVERRFSTCTRSPSETRSWSVVAR